MLRDPLGAKVRRALQAPQNRKGPRAQKATRVHREIQELPVRQACWDPQGHQGCRGYPEFLVQKVTKVTRVIRETRATKVIAGHQPT